MRIELGESYCTLYREPGDKRISHESTVGYHMRQLLNREFRDVPCTEPACGGHGVNHLVPWRFVRTNPSKHGLTACTVGMIDHKADVAIWHERYQIENAATEFNRSGKVTFQRVNEVSR